ECRPGEDLSFLTKLARHPDALAKLPPQGLEKIRSQWEVVRSDLAETFPAFSTLVLTGFIRKEAAQATEQKAAAEAKAASGGGQLPPQPSAPLPDGPFGTDGFRYRSVEVRFGRAAKRKSLVLALWDEKNHQPRAARPVQDVLNEVYGEDHDTDDATFRQLCA